MGANCADRTLPGPVCVGLAVVMLMLAGAGPLRALPWEGVGRITVSPRYSGDHFGCSVALSGDTAIVGAPLFTTNDRGAVYFFERTATGWTQTGRISGESGGDGFGWSVDLSGDHAIVGAPKFASNDRGAAYIFEKSGSSWQQVSRISGESSNDQLGWSVGIHDGRAIVGAPYFATNDRGGAYIYEETASAWTKTTRISGESTDDLFGWSVDISGDETVVGAPQFTTTDRGGVYFYEKTSSGWTNTKRTTGEFSGDQLGWNVALDGDRAVLGAPLLSTLDWGAAYVWEKTASGWTKVKRIRGEFGGDRFGSDVDVDDNRVVIGSPLLAGGYSGALYVFERDGDDWQQSARFTGEFSGDQLGTAVAIDRYTCLAGAPMFGSSDYGAAYVYQAVPEPTTMLLVGSGLLGALGLLRGRRVK